MCCLGRYAGCDCWRNDGGAPRDVFLQRYLVTDGPDARFRYSTTALNDGRNSMGIYNSLSFLIEGKNGLTVEENIRERARQQLETMKAFLMFASENATEVKALVEVERMKLSGEGAPTRYLPTPGAWASGGTRVPATAEERSRRS